MFYLTTEEIIFTVIWHGLLFSISKNLFYVPTDRIVHTMALVTPVVEHCFG